VGTAAKFVLHISPILYATFYPLCANGTWWPEAVTRNHDQGCLTAVS